MKKLLKFLEYNFGDQVQCSNGCWNGSGFPKGIKYCGICGSKTTLRKNLKCDCGKKLECKLISIYHFCDNCGRSISDSWKKIFNKYNK